MRDCLIFLQVNVREQGKTALHCAVYMANMEVLKLLLEFKPNLELPVEYTIALLGAFKGPY